MALVKLICWYWLKVLTTLLICASDGENLQMYWCYRSQHVSRVSFYNNTKRKWRMLDIPGLFRLEERPLEVTWSNVPFKAVPAMKLDEVHHSVVQASFEYFHRQGCHTTAGQSLPAPSCSACQNSFHHIQQEFTLRPPVVLVLLLCTSEECLAPYSIFEGISEIPHPPLPQAFWLPCWNNSAPAGFCTTNQYSLTQAVACSVGS